MAIWKYLLIISMSLVGCMAFGDAWEEAMKNVLNHDARVPPNYEHDYPTVVKIQLFIVSFDSISESTMDYSMSIFLRQTWHDHRLKYTKLQGVDKLELDARAMDTVAHLSGIKM